MADNQPTVPGAQGVSPGGQVKNLGGAMSVQPGQEVQDKGQQLQVQPERPADGQQPVQQQPTQQQQTPPPAPEQQQTPPAEEDKPDPRFTPYTEELTKNGKLSAESITKAAKEFGVSEKVVQAYVDAQAATLAANNDAGNRALHDSQIGAVKEVAGGDQQWNDYREWATANDEGSLRLISDAVNGNSPEVSKIVVKAAMDKARAQGWGGGPRDATNSAQGGGQVAATGFKSAAEQSAALNDPKYRRDPAYRAEVDKKIIASSF